MGERKKTENKKVAEDLKIILGETFAEYVNASCENLGIPVGKMMKEIAKIMSLDSADEKSMKSIKPSTVSKYRSDGVAEKQIEKLLNACIEFEVNKNSDRVILGEFIEKYTEIAEKLLKRSLNIKTQALPYLVTYSHVIKEKEKEQWDNVICPKALCKRLDAFFDNDNKKIIIIQGTRKSGLTVSVTKYLLDRQKDQEETVISCVHDIECSKDEELLGRRRLQEELKGKWVIIRLGYRKFKYYDFFKSSNAKIIVLAHNLVEIENSKEVDKIVFNDIVNHTQGTKEMLGYVSKWFEMSTEDSEQVKEKKKLVCDKIHDITGGIPIAVQKIGKIIQDLYHINGIGIDQILSKNLWEYEAGKNVYEELWNELMKSMWERVGEKERHVLERIACVAQGVSKKMMWKLADMKPDGAVLDNMLNNLLLMEDGKSRNCDISYPGVRFFPLMRNLILYKISTDKSIDEKKLYAQCMEKALECLMDELDAEEMKGIYKGRRCFLDREGEIQAVSTILKYCAVYFESDKYMSLTAKLEPFFSLRGKNDEIVKSIYEQRLKLTRDKKYNEEVLVSYSYIINRRIMRGEKNDAEKDFAASVRFIAGHEIQEALVPIYQLMKIKYNIYIKQNYEAASEVIQKIRRESLPELKRLELEYYIWLCEWKQKSVIDTAMLEKQVNLFLDENTLEYRVFKIQYELFLSELCINQCIVQKQNDVMKQIAIEILKDTEETIKYCSCTVPYQICLYNFQKACMAALDGKKWQEFMEKAQNSYIRTDRGIWKKKKEEYLNNICKGMI